MKTGIIASQVAIAAALLFYSYTSATVDSNSFRCSTALYQFLDGRGFVICQGIDAVTAEQLFSTTAFSIQNARATARDGSAVALTGTAILVDRDINILEFNDSLRGE